jgi:hypothetical protein
MQRCEYKPSVEELDARLPFIIEFFTVQFCGSKYMAYRDSDGKWRRAFDNLELPDAISLAE